MKNNEEVDIEVRLIKYKILTAAYLVVLVTLFGFAIKTENELLLMLSSVTIGLLVLLNFRYIIINKKTVNSIQLYQKDVTKTELHPLELYLLERIWYHKKKKFTKRQLYAAILYEIEKGSLELTEKGIKISSGIDLDKLTIYSLMTMEMSLLNRCDCRKARRLKIAKLKRLQEEQIIIVIADIVSNISNNCLDRDIFYEQMNEMKAKYFIDVETMATVYLTISSWVCVLLVFIFAFSFCSKANILNFYLPIGLVVMLVATLTSKYRERVIIKPYYRTFICDSLNYIHSLKISKKSRINEIYACCLEKSNDSSIISMFKK